MVDFCVHLHTHVCVCVHACEGTRTRERFLIWREEKERYDDILWFYSSQCRFHPSILNLALFISIVLIILLGKGSNGDGVSRRA